MTFTLGNLIGYFDKMTLLLTHFISYVKATNVNLIFPLFHASDNVKMIYIFHAKDNVKMILVFNASNNVKMILIYHANPKIM